MYEKSEKFEDILIGFKLIQLLIYDDPSFKTKYDAFLVQKCEKVPIPNTFKEILQANKLNVEDFKFIDETKSPKHKKSGK